MKTAAQMSNGTHLSCRPPALLSHNQLEALDYALAVSAMGGLMGAAFIVLTLLLLDRSVDKQRIWPIFFISAIDLCLATSYLIDAFQDLGRPRDVFPRTWTYRWDQHDGGCEPSALCLVLGATAQFCALSLVVWYAIVSRSLLNAISSSPAPYSCRNLVLLHSCAWGLPALSVVVIASIDGFGFAGSVCWISTDKRWAWFAFFRALIPQPTSLRPTANLVPRPTICAQYWGANQFAPHACTDVPMSMTISYALYVSWRARHHFTRLMEGMSVSKSSRLVDVRAEVKNGRVVDWTGLDWTGVG